MNNKIYIVIVLYQTELKDSVAFNSLSINIKALTIPYELLIFNNSPEIRIPYDKAYSVVSTTNIGLAYAYNYALDIASRSHCTWLLLLDQDTKLTMHYFEAINAFAGTQPHNIHYAAAVPILTSGHHYVSPEAFHIAIGPFWKNKAIHNNQQLQQYNNRHYCITALNSGTILNIKLLQELGGFPLEFPLDGLDHAYFYMLHQKHMTIHLLPTKLQHNLSLLERKLPNIERYASYLHANYLLAKRMHPCAFVSYKCRVCILLLKTLIYGTLKHTRLTLNYLITKW